ncbi:type II toxin-antitoxin system VapC family toxin [Actinomycetospora termitidis]|uniref:Ribonuclease VapC n=1 Tax=Actinomycetospora termitidis TaxID=3053470 RepID=A0ABT7M175_9PSEU|nr:type II toxin-antitoxin system VapC family toxin [Actinomycetospora sp. Odt1-22]MDL5154413.1 type II toxin-antitoxin system VapC family toxin [Actinomycetospora sp. Odt1-22]
MSIPEQTGAAGPAASETVVVDASVAVELLAGTPLAVSTARRLRGTVMHVPAHFAAEVLSALGRLERAGTLREDEVALALRRLAEMPVTEHPVPGLLPGAWQRRGRLRLLDALYVELSEQLDAVVLTTDLRLARAGEGRVEAVTGA